MEELILKAENISRDYAIGRRKVRALEPVDVEVDAGQFWVVTGPSGSGKTTLLNLLSGFDRPTDGIVEFRGTSLASLSDFKVAQLRNESFGFIHQTPHLMSHKTVLENVALPFLYGAWIGGTKVYQRSCEMLEYVGMLELQNRYPATLSGGEMQRVVFARALVRDPEVIFADEPTGSLDADNSGRILKLLKQQSELGRSVIMVSHDADAVKYGSYRLSLFKSKNAVVGAI
ncbi:ABC transporter ATP-binding protein [Desulfosediminicola sp.]|uniref:ABC transporter ATP-binding protein n=1 Tax=Desulfosediminicola sp. TaxID=2886825 RepID=UPI003AF2DF2F